MKRVIVSSLLIVFSCSSYAGFECRGAVTDVTVAPDGDVYMGKFKNWSWMKVCNVSRAENGATPEACKAIYSLLLTAQTTKKEVSFWFTTGDCEAGSQTPWQYMSSWYFGPKLVD